MQSFSVAWTSREMCTWSALATSADFVFKTISILNLLKIKMNGNLNFNVIFKKRAARLQSTDYWATDITR